MLYKQKSERTEANSIAHIAKEMIIQKKDAGLFMENNPEEEDLFVFKHTQKIENNSGENEISELTRLLKQVQSNLIMSMETQSNEKDRPEIFLISLIAYNSSHT